MVLLVEPGCYDPEIGGVRSEYMLRVTGDGCEVMHRFEHRLSVEPLRDAGVTAAQAARLPRDGVLFPLPALTPARSTRPWRRWRGSRRCPSRRASRR